MRLFLSVKWYEHSEKAFTYLRVHYVHCYILHKPAYIYSDLSLNLVKGKDMLVWLIFFYVLLLSPFKV